MTDDLIQSTALGLQRQGIPYSEVPRLAQPTPAAEIKQRPGPHSKSCQKPCQVQHKALDYVDARYVMRVLDTVCGPDGWQRTHIIGNDGRVACGVGILIDGEWVWKWDGAGETDIEGEKGSFSDSFKRAAVNWGIARDLYDKDTGRPAQRSSTADEGRADRPPARPLPPQSNGSAAQDALDAAYDADVPICPHHRKEMRNGRYGWFCSGKGGDGPLNAKGYCNYKAD